MQSVEFPASPDSTATHMSWASKVKKTPRNLTSLSPSSPLTSSQKEQKIQAFRKGQLTPNVKTEAEVEEVIVKKRKKKKNKSRSNNDNQDHERSQNGNIILQEPPKIQDNEEFPDLMSSFGGGGERRLRFGTSNTPCYSETTKQATESAKTKRGGRKSKVPVQFNLGGMLAALEQKQHTEKAKPSPKPVVLSVGGGIPVLPRETLAVTKHQQTKASSAPHNPLDSSSPMVKKGKQREVPKAKKPTSLKKIILKEREERKQRQTSVILDTMQQSEEVECLEEDKPQSEDSLLRIEELIEIPADAPEFDNELLEGHTVATEGPSPGTLQISNLPKIHSRRFREYCSQVLSKEVDSCVTDLLKELVRFQDRLYLKDPVKAKAKRRLVMGLREVSKHLKLRKLKCIIISPNCEKIQSKGGLDEALQTIISCACEQNVPFVFALNRKALGWCVNKAVPVSVVGIFSYDGAQDHFHKLYELTMQARQAYKDMIAALQEQQTENDSGEDKLERSVDKQQRLDEVTTVSAAEETDEPNYIKLWKKMLEEEYIPYALNLEETVAADMLNLQL